MSTSGRWAALAATWLLWVAGCQGMALTAAKLYIKQEKPQQAREQLELGLQTEPSNPEIHYLLGKLAGEDGRYEDMIGHFDRCLELSPKFKPKIHERRRFYWSRIYNRGIREAGEPSPDFSSMAELFRVATTISPTRIEAWRNLAFAHYRLDKYDEAIEVYEHVIELAPADTATHSSLGVLYYTQGRLEEAEQTLGELLKLAPTHTGALTNLAVIYTEQGRLSDAEDTYRKAIEIDPDSWESHYNMGNLYWQQQNFAAARVAFERSVELDPEHRDSRYNLAITYISLNETEAALPLLQHLSEETPEDKSVWRELGRIYANKGMFAQSEDAYARAEPADSDEAADSDASAEE